MQKHIYIVLSQTGALTSAVLRLFTRNEFNHVSIALSPTLEKMYSFGRKYPYYPFIGGFVEEGKDIGTFKRFQKTKCMVLEVPVSDEKYKLLTNFIKYFIENKEKFHYSYFGVFCAAFKKEYKSSRKFYCSQFVRMCLACADVENANELPTVIKPMDFLKLNNNKVIYKGLLKNYQ